MKHKVISVISTTYLQYSLILKVPQAICAQKLWRGGRYVVNESYLNGAIFTRQFYDPAVAILGPYLSGLIFEQEYQRKKIALPHRSWRQLLIYFSRRFPKRAVTTWNCAPSLTSRIRFPGDGKTWCWSGALALDLASHP